MTTSTFKISALFSGLLVAASLLTAGTSFAQATKGVGSSIEGGPGMKPTASPDQRINRLDKNKDGQISREEASGHPKLLKGFDRIDVNKDGQLSRDELKAFHTAGFLGSEYGPFVIEEPMQALDAVTDKAEATTVE